MIGTARQIVAFLMDADMEKKWELKEYKPKHSSNANSYFHKLCDELRKYNKISMAHQKNDLVSSYGQFEYINDEIVSIRTQIPPEQMAEQESLHCQFVNFEDGVYVYRVCRGTRTYNTAEMALLIDGTVEECKQAGIETLPPYQIERMKATWKQKKDG